MRALMISVLALGISVGIYTVRAQARPKKIDYDAAICQKATSSGSVSYASGGITAGTDVSIVCPLQYVTLDEDTPPGANVMVKMTVKMRTGGFPSATTTTCQVVSAGLPFVSLPGFLSAGIVSNSGNIALPTTDPGDPVGLRVACTSLKAMAQIFAIQTQLDPLPP